MRLVHDAIEWQRGAGKIVDIDAVARGNHHACLIKIEMRERHAGIDRGALFAKQHRNLFKPSRDKLRIAIDLRTMTDLGERRRKIEPDQRAQIHHFDDVGIVVAFLLRFFERFSALPRPRPGQNAR